MGLKDLEDLISTCRTEEAKKFIKEALASYQAGAYRASIVASWIAVVYDLVSKVREISISGDREAVVQIRELDSWQSGIATKDISAIRNSLEFERNIISLCHEKFGFFDAVQLTDLNRLHEDRNRCAHPTFTGDAEPYMPSAELARAHLTHAVTHVLSQAPVQGRAATEAIIRAVRSQYFPTETADAKVTLNASGLQNARSSLFRSVIDLLVFSFFESDTALGGQLKTIVAIKAAHELNPIVIEPRIQKHINKICRDIDDGKLLMVLAFHHNFKLSWSWLEADNRKRLQGLIETLEGSDMTRAAIAALKMDELEESAIARIKRFSEEDLAKAVKISTEKGNVPHNAIVEIAVQKYCSSVNWSKANALYNSLMEPLQDHLTVAQVIRVIRSPVDEEADLRGAHSFQQFLTHVQSSQLIPRDQLLTLLNELGMSDQAPSEYGQRSAQA